MSNADLPHSLNNAALKSVSKIRLSAKRCFPPVACCAAAILLLTPACRSGRIRGSLVKVTESPGIAEIESPAQRLVGSQRNPGSNLRRRDEVPENRRVSLASASLASDEMVGTPPSSTGLDSSLPPAPAASDLEPSGDLADAKSIAGGSMTKDDTKTASNSAFEKAKYESMLKAFESYPPQVRREAMRRLTASMAATATKSDQPGGVADALSAQLADLPELPAVDPNSNRVAQRLGVSPSPLPQTARQASSWSTSNLSDLDPTTQMLPTPPRQRVATSRRRQSAPPVAQVADAGQRTDPVKPSIDVAPSAPVLDDSVVIDQAAAGSSAPTVRVATLPLDAFAANPKTGELQPAAPRVEQMEMKHSIADLSSESASPPDSTHASTVAHPTHSVLQNTSVAAAKPIATSTFAQSTMLQANPSPVSQVAATESDMDQRPLATADNAALFEHLIKKLSIAPESETDAERTARLIKLRHIVVLSGDPEAASQKVDGMSDPQQQYLRHQLKGLWTMVDPDGHPIARRRLTSAAKELREATRHASAGSDSLEVRAVSFCTAIEAYGQTTPFKKNQFKPGQQVILYCEVENFTASKLDGGFETHLQGSYDILDADGNKVDGQLLPADRQVSSNYLRDYFIAYQMGLPNSLPAGDYTLQLTIEDLNGRKYGQGKASLTMTK